MVNIAINQKGIQIGYARMPYKPPFWYRSFYIGSAEREKRWDEYRIMRKELYGKLEDVLREFIRNRGNVKVVSPIKSIIKPAREGEFGVIIINNYQADFPWWKIISERRCYFDEEDFRAIRKIRQPKTLIEKLGLRQYKEKDFPIIVFEHCFGEGELKDIQDIEQEVRNEYMNAGANAFFYEKFGLVSPLERTLKELEKYLPSTK